MNGPFAMGFGSHYGDDQAGWLIVDRLRDLGYPESLLRKGQHPADLLDVMDQSHQLLICDACQGAGSVGTIHRWQWPSDQISNLHAHGTHEMGLNEVLQIADTLGWRPSSITILAVEGETWYPSFVASAKIVAAVEAAARSILSETIKVRVPYEKIAGT